MFAKFLNLDQEKRERILNAALQEFAQKGFEKASTNSIVKEAGISKGLLFHYFKSKKDLFLFLYDYFTEMLETEFYQKFDLREKDIFQRFKQLMMLKAQLIKKHPEIVNFLLAAYFEDSAEVKGDLNNRNSVSLTSAYDKIFQDIDTAKFKDDIDLQRAIKIIMWTFDGLRNQQVEKEKLSPSGNMDYEEIYTEIDVYIEMFKKLFYK